MNKHETVIKNCFNSWIDNDMKTFESSFADDVLYVESWGPAYRKKEHILSWFGDWQKKNKVLLWDIKNFYHDGNVCTCEWFFKCRARGEVTGFDGVSIITFDETGKITSIKEFQSKTPNYYPYENEQTKNEQTKNEQPKLNPFVKWAGGKKQLLAKLAERAPKSYGTYYEPFVGGGALLFEFKPKRAVINDINPQLCNAYKELKKDAAQIIELLKELDALPCNRERYINLRSAYNEKIKKNELDAECAALMIWLNKHCFNGLYRVNSNGLFNVPYNNNASGRSMNAANLKAIGAYLKEADVDIRVSDFAAACIGVRADDFVYFDSPYISAGKTANFTDYTMDGFSFEDHKRLAKLYRRLDSLGAKLMLSNHETDMIYELYNGYNIEAIDVRRSINRDAAKRIGREVIIKNY